MIYGRTLLRWKIIKNPINGKLIRMPRRQNSTSWLRLTQDNMMVSQPDMYCVEIRFGEKPSLEEEKQKIIEEYYNRKLGNIDSVVTVI